MRKTWIVLPAAALAAGLILPASAGAAPAVAAPRVSSGVPVAAGTVTGMSGAAMPGTTVDLYAWPSDAALKALPAGATVPLTLLATAITNSAGQYTLAVPAAKLQAAAVSDGYANLEIYSPAGEVWYFPYQTGTLPARPSAPVTVNLGASKAKLSCGTAPRGVTYNFTGLKKLRYLEPSWSVAGQGYIVPGIHTRYDKLAFEYGQTSSQSQASTLGVGLSGGAGVSVGYTDTGTNVSSSTSKVTFPVSYGNALFNTEFVTLQTRGECYATPPFAHVHLTKQKGCPKHIHTGGHRVPVIKCYWQVQSAGWFGGDGIARPKNAPATPKHWCAPYLRTTTYSRDRGIAIQWSDGYQLGFDNHLFNTVNAYFNTKAQTGYDNNAYMSFYFGRDGYLCGTNGNDSKAALLVQRGNKE
jgi:hypothetical protein